ncbi:heavy metal translocating P-type ATPase [Fulvivirgaceae bacterium BMA10]|uniref:Heavy metal translocating P-type ATPase n=1 Tax=Splendidivirga corallicola TaxID=3051826 RepID=A0ABT8KMB3_9BACT|nr:heavy metal translocating P-type ATPase [Fulvivirgaceae bacterium BMA10]
MKNKNAEMLEKHAYTVKGMTCAACAINVEKVLKKQKGVEEATVNYGNHTATIQFDDHKISFKSLKKSVKGIGYDLVKEEDSNTLRKEREEEYRDIRRRLILATIFSFPVFLLAMVFTDVPYANWIMLFLTFPVIVWSGQKFFVGAWKQTRHLTANMDTLIALGTGTAFLYSAIVTVFPNYFISKGIPAHVYFESAVVIITFILLGNFIESRVKGRTFSAIEMLIGLQSNEATRLVDQKEELVLISEVRIGDILIVKPGEKIPVDGIVTNGSATVDESMITGEPLGVEKKQDDILIAGTINISGHLYMRAMKVGEATMLARIIRLVKDAQGTKAPAQKLADKVAGIFVPIVILIATGSALIWYFIGPSPQLTHAVLIFVTVLIIACPCALGLATPTAIAVGIGKAAKSGILVKDASAFEIAKHLDVLLVDKTGTVTKGVPKVTDFYLNESKLVSEKEIEKIIHTLEKKSGHPLSKAIMDYLPDAGEAAIEDFKNLPGLGIKGTYRNKTFFIGNEALLLETGFVLTDEIKHKFERLKNEGKTLVFCAAMDEVIGIIGIADEIKETSYEAVKKLQQAGINIIMLTGDIREAAEKVASSVGIEDVRAKLLPADKANVVKELKAEGRIVGMAGDGINDAPALAMADLGIAMGDGTDIAMESAPMTILKGDLSQIANAIRLSKETVRTIKENLFWAFFYNVITIPIAAGVLYPINGFLLDPMIAGAAMAFSSVSVVLNSLRLKVRKI